MLALVASRRRHADRGGGARRKGRPVVLIQGGIHAGEIDGKDAGFLALRELLEGKRCAGRRSAASRCVFVPVFNVDGHERFGRNNRPNQSGPEEIGWRVTSAEPEPQPRLREGRRARDAGDAALLERVGSRSSTSICTSPTARSSSTTCRSTSRRRSPATTTLRAGRRRPARRLMQRADGAGLAAARLLPVVRHGRRSGVRLRRRASRRRASRRSTGPSAQRIGILVETHSWKPYPTRVRVTRNSDRRAARARGRERRRSGSRRRAAADRDGADARRHQRAARATQADRPRPRTIDFRGYAYTPRAVGDLGRPRDALRPDDAAGLARAALRRRCSRR